ncbi:regulator of microtubule dynamics protein 1 [Parasteatoda tepidariorum]|uniref:regulator of microtubule dynamics protein 1 n=1 Tax=Parasteatoda tepidariorum TaxID=114398 RepID=UPI00077FCC97|nr:regulator of microtubule dynamics protein 1 [Parasteatoda tepidariorum]XP_015921676.1 regulator of microtubule dynamics protein 1 [Parasteatoda tepidariorum]XP_015921677.1 regulator of microtubule dynamics protein 1 [Parasteatoda tepidariorum]
MNSIKLFQRGILLRNLLRHFSIKCGQHQNKTFIRKLSSSFSNPKYTLPSLVSSLLFIKALTNDKSDKIIIEEADNLYDEAKFGQLHSVIYSHKTSDNPEILWRVARSIFENSRNENDKDRLASLEEALDIVERALEINEQCWAAHKWKAILLDYVWRYKSTKERIIHSFDIKKHMKRAIELNPKDGTSYYILGEWCYTFADMPWYQRKVAAAIFASPPTSTYEEALSCFETAEKVEPLFYSMNLLMMGKCHLKMNNKDEATKFLKMVLEYPVKTPDDQKAREEAEKLLKTL